MDYGILTYTQIGTGVMPNQWHLRLGSMTIGSGIENDVRLNDPAVSRFHARFLATEDGCLLVDLNSATGTFLNQVRLQPNMRHPLQDGDTIMVGTWTIRYSRPEPTPDIFVQPVVQVLPPEVAAKLPQMATPIEPAPTISRLRGNRAQRVRRQLPEAQEGSSYMQYLPPMYQDDEFLSRFLLIFESILEPLDQTIDSINHYFDPRLAPEALLPWLAAWVDVVLNDKWPIERRRELITMAAELYRWRGTRRGLREYLRIYAGVEPLVEEPGREQDDSPRLPAHVFRVTLEVPNPDVIERDLVEAIIEAEKPAFTSYQLEIRRADIERS